MSDEVFSQFINNERLVNYKNYDLSAVTALLKYFGNPHRNVKTVHIAGTNGKGSVAHMLAGILKHAGYQTGLYTSPHLIRINERITVNNEGIDDQTLELYDYEISRAAGILSVTPTYFDALTIAAFSYFNKVSCDIAVIETGLGGRLDSTNVIIPLCSIITDISFDHMTILGDTIESIAAEKAGIIKNSVPVITSNRDQKVLNVLDERSRSCASDFYVFERDYCVLNKRREGPLTFFEYRLKDICAIHDIPIKGHQSTLIKNSAGAITASLIIKNSFPDINHDAIRTGLKNTKIPGRMEVLSTGPLVLFDPAHNPSALASVLNYLKSEYKDHRLICVLSFMKDKDISSMLSITKDLAEVVYFCLDDARAAVIRGGEYPCIGAVFFKKNDLIEFLKKEASLNTLIFFTGTFRLYRTALDCAACLETHAKADGTIKQNP